MKRITMSLMAFLLFFSTLLVGCNSNDVTNDAKKVEVSAPGDFPIVEEKITLKVLAAQRAFVEDFETNEFTKWLEEKTNIHLEWEVVPEGEEAKQKLNLSLASGDHPDIYLNMPISAEQIELYGQQGVFLPLNELIDKYGTETKKMFEEHPIVKERSVANDGNIYSFPDVNECFHCTYSGKMWINQTWLDTLGLDMPETTEDYYNALKAFKTQDPNGNGKADEVPLAGTPNGWNSDFVPFLMNSFIFTKSIGGGPKYIYLNDGKIDVAFNKPEWREGLEYIHKLYKDGLIAEQSFTQDLNQLKSIADGEGALGSSAGGTPLVFTNLPTENYKNFAGLAPLKGPKGEQNANMLNDGGVLPGKLVISSSTKYAEAAVRLADAFYNEEIMMKALFGDEGKEWREAKEGEVSVTGEQAEYFVSKKGEEMQNKHWNQAAPHFRTNEWRDRFAMGEAGSDPMENIDYILYKATEKYVPYTQEDKVVPPLVLNEEQSSEILDVQKSIQDLVDEMTIRFITGDADIDKEWDGFVQSLENMNLNRYVEIMQEAYDSKYSK